MVSAPTGKPALLPTTGPGRRDEPLGFKLKTTEASTLEVVYVLINSNSNARKGSEKRGDGLTTEA